MRVLIVLALAGCSTGFGVSTELAMSAPSVVSVGGVSYEARHAWVSDRYEVVIGVTGSVQDRVQRARIGQAEAETAARAYLAQTVCGTQPSRTADPVYADRITNRWTIPLRC